MRGGVCHAFHPMLWTCEYWGPDLAGNDAMISTSLGGVRAFGAWIRKCLAPWWPLFKCTKTNDGTVEAGWDGYQPQTPWYPCLISGGGGPAYGFIMTFRIRAILFSSFWGPGWCWGGGFRSASGNSWFDGPVLWDSKGTQQWTTSWREEKLLKNSLPETDSFTGKKGEMQSWPERSINVQVRSPVSFREGEPGRSTSPNSFSPSSGEIATVGSQKGNHQEIWGFSGGLPQAKKCTSRW